MKSNYISKGLIILLSLQLLAMLSSCKKYPEGPALSLRTRAERLANTWKVDNYKIDGSDFTSLVSGYKESFTKQGAYSYDWGILDGSGTWVFQNSDNEVKLSGSDNQSSRTLILLQLREKTLWYYYMQNGERHELHMVPN
ncbi:MAG: hypothetical protein IT236_12710 [Bacteroidia bacterium]|nr:hypothetical protein [Bacteroidia bacterium]